MGVLKVTPTSTGHGVTQHVYNYQETPAMSAMGAKHLAAKVSKRDVEPIVTIWECSGNPAFSTHRVPRQPTSPILAIVRGDSLAV